MNNGQLESYLLSRLMDSMSKKSLLGDFSRLIQATSIYKSVSRCLIPTVQERLSSFKAFWHGAMQDTFMLKDLVMSIKTN